MQLDEFYFYKNKLIEHLLSNETIVSLVDDSVSIKNAKSLMYKNVFPFEYVPETIEYGKTFICCDVDIQKVYSKTFLSPVLYVWVFTHKSLLRLPNGEGVRTDKLCSEICKLVNGSREYGLGELDLYGVKRFAPMTDYQGKCMMFQANEFNRSRDPNKYTPSNRRQGQRS